LSLQQFQEIASETAVRFRTAMSAGDSQTAKNLLGSLEYLVLNTESAAERLTRTLNDWVAFLVLPLFALANAGVTFSGGALRAVFTSHVAWGVFVGLVLGKPVGIFAFAWLAVRWRLADLPRGVQWRQLAAVGALAGIGFTVSIFISSLAFDDPTLIAEAKIAILVASLLAGVIGYGWLSRSTSEGEHSLKAQAVAES
jgi:NhaA family Na+:H+ antiporter